jgi:hypothetical protein
LNYTARVAGLLEEYTKRGDGIPSENASMVAWIRDRESKTKREVVHETEGYRVKTEVKLTMPGCTPISIQRRVSFNDLTKVNVPPPQRSTATAGGSRLEVPSDRRYDYGRDGGRGRSKNPDFERDSNYGGAREDERSSAVRGRDRSSYDENVPREGVLRQISEVRHTGRQRSGAPSRTRLYQYDTSRPVSRVPSIAPSRDPSRERYRSHSRAPSRQRSAHHSRASSRHHSRAPSRHGARMEDGRDRRVRSHRVNEDGSKRHRTEAERREKDARKKAKKERR